MRILLAADQVWLRSALRLFLEHEPNLEVVGEVGDARALPAAMASLHPDLILLDWGLTDVKAPRARQQLIATLRARQPQVYILALTSSHETNSDSPATSVNAFVSKAEPPDRVLAAVHQAEAAYAGASPDARRRSVGALARTTA
jgi:DNA-binding NarL/FixJ family response regulator